MGACASKGFAAEHASSSGQHHEERTAQIIRDDSSQSPAGPWQQINNLLLSIHTIGSPAARAPETGLVLPEVCECIVGQLGAVDLCSITAIVEQDGAPSVGVLLAAHGTGARVVEANPIMRAGGDQAWSALQLRPGVCCSFSVKGGQDPGTPLPQDIAKLHEQAGMRSFMSVLVETGGQVQGALMVASADPNAFDVAERWQMTLATAAAALLPHMLSPHVAYLSKLLVAFDGEEDVSKAASLMIQGVSFAMLQAANVKMEVRIGLVQGERLLLLEQKLSKTAGAPTAANSPAQLQLPSPGPIVATQLTLANTLLRGAIDSKTARFVADSAWYFQTATQPVEDIFTPASGLVLALVAVPLFQDDSVFGGLYFAKDVSGSCSHHEVPLVNVTHLVQGALWRKLHGQIDSLSLCAPKDSVSSLQPVGSSSGSGTGSATPLLLPQAPAADAPDAPPAAASELPPAQPPAGHSTGKPLCTDAILKAVQHKLSVAHTVKAQGVADDQESRPPPLIDLQLTSMLGKGGFGTCWKGTFHGAPVAAKVLCAKDQRQVMKDAMEIGVLSHVRHPNIVQIYERFTDMVESSNERHLPVYRPVLPQELRNGIETRNIIVMEYCDLGTLRDALRRGICHRRIDEATAGVDLQRVLKVLLPVAHSVRHIHERKLLHCDIKMDNVLLKSDPTQELGFCCKLADFGLSKMLNDRSYVYNRSGGGTVTHIAPEVMRTKSKLTTAVDAYSFGIIMYEIITTRRAYPGMRPGQIVAAVLQGERPEFPPGMPERYTQLAKCCWSAEPEMRPSFTDITAVLQDMLAAGNPQLMA